MPIKNVEYLEVPEQKKSTKQSKLKDIISELVRNIEDLKNQKADTTHLKASYREFAESTNASVGLLNAKIEAIESSLKKLTERFEELESMEI